METTSLPAMTQWQFYAAFIVQCVIGILYGYAMFIVSQRDPKLGWKPGAFGQWVRDKLFIIFIILAGVASYELLPDIYHAMVNDVADVAAETITQTASSAIEGNNSVPEIDGIDIDMRSAMWGEMDAQQNEAITLMTGFWMFIGLFIYVGNFKASPVGFFKKLVKVIAYSCLTCVLLFIPKDIHYFTWDEVMPSVVLLAMGVVGVLVTYSGNKLPPPLPAPNYNDYHEDYTNRTTAE